MTPRTKREYLRKLVAGTHCWSKVRFPTTGRFRQQGAGVSDAHRRQAGKAAAGRAGEPSLEIGAKLDRLRRFWSFARAFRTHPGPRKGLSPPVHRRSQLNLNAARLADLGL